MNEMSTGGNCRAWSENVYTKLFLDANNKSATLAVVKVSVPINYKVLNSLLDRDLLRWFVHRSRTCSVPLAMHWYVWTTRTTSKLNVNLGGKNDSAAQMFVYDLMKTDWESRVPHVEAIELNIDIIMSSSPLYTTSQSLLNLIRVEKVCDDYGHVIRRVVP